jgi:uncharacterized Zn-binding protein involved in type VI secretion
MPGFPAALKGHMHLCPVPGHVGGPVVSTTQNFVRVNGVPIATIGDKTLCSGIPATAAIAEGSSVARINGKNVARLGDRCEHGGKLSQGEVWIRFE